ncbi:hypothetical protein PSEEN4549 [Pseudomonas entomophila L48]|uniref:Uncharacterized protein n=1 Tax=Pseudomonas entomophila (strain L48) TaxID=384676 RepID=Q1I556_PSEE4|nr:hypothetical protein PSEEN4549 [Pseudomonas entomophila L48]
MFMSRMSNFDPAPRFTSRSKSAVNVYVHSVSPTFGVRDRRPTATLFSFTGERLKP